MLYVLGRYTEHRDSTPEMLDPFLAASGQAPVARTLRSQMVCAFGRAQIECLRVAAASGLDVRVGFENGVWRRDGTVGATNAELVSDLLDGLT